jgi:hypothetical protein
MTTCCGISWDSWKRSTQPLSLAYIRSNSRSPLQPLLPQGLGQGQGWRKRGDGLDQQEQGRGQEEKQEVARVGALQFPSPLMHHDSFFSLLWLVSLWNSCVTWRDSFLMPRSPLLSRLLCSANDVSYGHRERREGEISSRILSKPSPPPSKPPPLAILNPRFSTSAMTVRAEATGLVAWVEGCRCESSGSSPLIFLLTSLLSLVRYRQQHQQRSSKTKPSSALDASHGAPLLQGLFG